MPKQTHQYIFVALLSLMILSACQKKPVPAPDVTFQLINGSKISLSERQGKPTLVVFWATTCMSCLKEIPHFIQLYQKYKAKGLEIIAVAMPYDRPDHVVEMQKAKSIPYPIALDIKADVVRAFGNVSITPNSFLISSNGIIIKHHIGLWDITELSNLIRTELNTKG